MSQYSLRAILLIILIITVPISISANNTSAFGQVPDTYDLDGNGLICRGAEVEKYALYIAKKNKGGQFLAEADRNNNAEIDASENQILQKMLMDEQSQILIDIMDSLGSSDCIAISELDSKSEAELGKPIELGNLMVRRHHEQITIFTKKKSTTAVEGALFSYTVDFEEQERTAAARGAVLYPFQIIDTPSSPSDACSSQNFTFSAASVTPSFSFDRSENQRNKSRDINSLTYRLGTQLEFCGGSLFDTQYFTTWVTYNTDMEHDARIFAVEADYQPFANVLGLGGANFLLDGAIAYRWSFAAHVEYGRVEEPGARPNISKDEEFLRVGPKLGFDFWVDEGPLQKLHFYTNWTHFENLQGREEITQLLITGLEYPLGGFNEFLLKAEYRKGDIPLVQNVTNEMTVGLSVKF